MKLIVTAHELHYDGRAHMKGETFDASEKHAQLLKLLKKAADAPANPMGHVETTRPAPSPPAEEASAISEVVGEDAPKRSRVYRRRDLTAED